MTQQVFADFIGLAPATLSSIYNERTRPTLSVVEAIKKKIPNISTDWLMFGSGEMYESSPASTDSLFLMKMEGRIVHRSFKIRCLILTTLSLLPYNRVFRHLFLLIV